MLSGHRGGHQRGHRVSRERGLPGDAWPRCAPWACPSSSLSPTHVVIHGVGPARPARRRAARSTWAMPARPCACSPACCRRKTSHSQLIGDASLMKRPMERVAKPLREMGADVRTRDGTPPVDIGGGQQPARHRLSHAGGERAGQIGDSAGGAVCRRRHHRHRAGDQPRSQRAHARKLRRAPRHRRVCASRLHPPQRLGESAAQRARRFLVGRLFHRRGSVGRGARRAC